MKSFLLAITLILFVGCTPFKSVQRSDTSVRHLASISEPIIAASSLAAAPHIDRAGLGCAQDQCVWAEADSVVANCSVNIYTPDWSAPGLLATIENPNCLPTGFNFVIPDLIRAKYKSINVNVTNPLNGTWSNPVLVAIASPYISSDECEASDLASLQFCMKALLLKSTGRVAITQVIICTGHEVCHFKIENFTGPALIYAKSTHGDPVGIHRTDDFGYSVFDIASSSKIEIRGITFQEGEVNQPAGLFGTAAYSTNLKCDVTVSGVQACAPTISILSQSSEITLEQISILESKGVPAAVVLGNTDQTAIRHSTIRHSWNNGIWSTDGTLPMVNSHVPSGLKIESNYFYDNRCSAIEVSAKGDSAISGNFLKHNHMGSIYGVPGGQLAIERNTDGLTISENEITDGRIDEDANLRLTNYAAVGIELTDNFLHNIIIRHNFIHDSPGAGIIQDAWATSCGTPNGVLCEVGPIQLMNNVLVNLSAGILNFNAATGSSIETGTCIGAQCQF
jgi:hypothetical protein